MKQSSAGLGAAGPTEKTADAVDEYSAAELPESERRSTLSITFVRMGYTVSATDVLFGMSLGLYFQFWTALGVAIGSSVLICLASLLTGLIGQREGLTTALIALGTAKWMQGATVSPDITRFAKGPNAVYITTLAEFIVGNLGFNLLGIIIGLAVGTGDMGAAFSTVGVGVLAAIAIFVQGFPHEVNNLYAGSLAGRSALSFPRLYVNIVSGVLAAGLAYYGLTHGLLQSFLKYLGYLAYAMPLIPGIMIADYFFVHRARYAQRVAEAEAVNWQAVFAFVIGLVINIYLGVFIGDSLWHALPLIGFVLYLLFSWRRCLAAWRR